MFRVARSLAILLWLAGCAANAAEDPELVAARQLLTHDIARQAAELGRFTGYPTIDARVLAAFGKVPRHLFVPPPLIPLAYADRPLPLGHGQNLTQPSVLALMTQALDLKPGQRVFETGTDTGYQAAILAELGVTVYSMEIVEPLLGLARKLLPELGHGNVKLELGDGYYGWAEHAPYDAMLIKESAVDVPPALWRQLKAGGRMLIPLGPPDGEQFLTLIIKHEDGRAQHIKLLPVRFAPFQGGTRI
jgi:protein-L-isoaspartate(D-aspartate) O-methyltransferase